MVREHIEFVTGKLAEHALRDVLQSIARTTDWEYTVTVLPITVAALMTPDWIARQWRPDPRVNRVVLPGYCEGDLTELERIARLPVQRGPRDLRRLPEFFGRDRQPREDYGAYAIEIIAEVNHAPRRLLSEVLEEARGYARDGADLIDIGCDPGGGWSGVGDCVRALRAEGLRVSIDSLDPVEISAAAEAGAELVLSVNASNRHAAVDWGCEVVIIPDSIGTLAGIAESAAALDRQSVPYRIDPILEPIGCGFARSLGRYLEVRNQWPAVRMLMGIGNLTELTDADSAAINLLLLGFCEELRIGSVLTTQVIPWARSSVRECAIARRLVHYSIQQGVPPKHLERSLVMLRDPEVATYTDAQLDELAAKIRDHNYRIFAERGEVHLVSAQTHWRATDPFQLFQQLLSSAPKNLDAGHAFYLGFEMAKAAVALALGKNYRQDEALEWGHLTVAESSHRIARSPRRGAAAEPDAGTQNDGEETQE